MTINISCPICRGTNTNMGFLTPTETSIASDKSIQHQPNLKHVMNDIAMYYQFPYKILFFNFSRYNEK